MLTEKQLSTQKLKIWSTFLINCQNNEKLSMRIFFTLVEFANAD